MNSSQHSYNETSSPIDNLSASPEALVYAIMSGDVIQAKLLVNLGVGISLSDAWIIFEACLHGIDMVQALSFNPHIDLNPALPGQEGDRVFHFLLRTPRSRFRSDKFETLRALLQRGVDPLESDRRGNNALHILAASPKASDIEGLLLLQLILCGGFNIPKQIQCSSLASINQRNDQGDGNTALVIAVQHNNEPYVRLLLEQGASPRVRGDFGRKPLFFAVARDFIAIARLLLTYGATIEQDIVALSTEMESLLAMY